MPRALLLDLDDTLYDYHPAEAQARRVVTALLSQDLGRPEAEVRHLWDEARRAVKARVGPRGASHSRLLYLHDLVHRAGRVDLLPKVRQYDRAFWTAFLQTARLRDGALDLLSAWKRAGHKIALVTDLTLDVQLWKLEHFDLLRWLDAVVVSEEVEADKPQAAIFELAAARLGVPLAQCVVLGDSPDRDIAGATALGLTSYLVRDSGAGPHAGRSLPEIARELCA